MSDSMKEDSSQVEPSAVSLAADMSLLDELFPSLGNGETSGNHLSNQLALLLQNLGSSDDECSNGPNLYNPLQLSPPRLNEIHALATASLISQTQEAIMQEYNFTDFDFDKCVNTDSNQENGELFKNETSIQDGFKVANEIDDKHDVVDDILGNSAQDISTCNVPCSAFDTITDKTRHESEISNKIPNISYSDNLEYSNILNINTANGEIDKNLTKVKLKTCETSTEFENKIENNPVESLRNITEPHTRPEVVFDHEFETHSAVQNILDTTCTPHVCKDNNVNKSVLTNEDHHISNDVRTKNFNQNGHFGDNMDSSDIVSNRCIGQTKLCTDLKRKHDTTDTLLPLKKRYVDSNAATINFNGIQSQDGKSNHHCNNNIQDFNNIQEEANSRSNTYIHGDLSTSKGNEKGLLSEKRIVYVCVICMKQFSNVDKLELHSTNHQQYTCTFPDCVRTFTYRSHLSYHKQTHDGEKNFQCSECGKVFSKAQHLYTHEVTHKETKPFTCNVCNKSFTTAGNLKNHSRIHSGERPFSCDVKGCVKTFAELSSLKKHKVTHTGEKSFKCDVCGKSFTQVSSKNYHMKKHKEKL